MADQVAWFDTLELELGVAQQDVLRIRPGQEVRLRVDALPSRTFEGRVSAAGGAVSMAGAVRERRARRASRPCSTPSASPRRLRP